MDAGLQSLCDWLKEHTNQEILIRKEEQEDLDEVRLQLGGVDYRSEAGHAGDDYISGSALLLQGKGTVITEGNEVELPSDVYEIALSEVLRTEVETESVRIETERASYLLTLQ